MAVTEDAFLLKNSFTSVTTLSKKDIYSTIIALHNVNIILEEPLLLYAMPVKDNVNLKQV